MPSRNQPPSGVSTLSGTTKERYTPPSQENQQRHDMNHHCRRRHCHKDSGAVGGARGGGRRRVQFYGSVLVRPIESGWDKKIRKHLYSTPSQLQRYRERAERVAWTVHESDTANPSPSCYSFAMWEAFDACVYATDVHDVPERVTEALESWVKRGTARRGLEKLIVPALSDVRRQHKQQVIQSVIAMTKSKTPEDIAESYKYLSEPASLYARLVGAADAEAAVGVHLDEEENHNDKSSSNHHDPDKKAENHHHNHKTREDKLRRKKKTASSLPMRQPQSSLTTLLIRAQ